MKRAAAIFLALMASTAAWSNPTVDGKASPGEYGKSISLDYDAITVFYQPDGIGGLTLAVTAATTGWVGIGLGSVVMDGAHIFMGCVADGKPVFSEQVGSGHSHQESVMRFADSFAVSQAGGTTTVEFHVPAGKLPVVDRKVSFIVAYSGAADLTTYHDDNHDGGTIDLSP